MQATATVGICQCGSTYTTRSPSTSRPYFPLVEIIDDQVDQVDQACVLLEFAAYLGTAGSTAQYLKLQALTIHVD